MRLLGHTISAVRTNAPGWLAVLLILGVYAAAISIERKARSIDVQPRALLSAPRRNWAFWRQVIYRTYRQIDEDRVLALAAGVVFYGLLALFPAITALVSSYALFAAPSTIGGHLATIASMMPSNAYLIVNEQVGRIVSRTTGDLGAAFLIGLALAVWSANAGIKAIIDALNIAYGAKERRGFIHLNLLSLTFTICAIAGLLLAIAAVIAMPVAMSYLPFGPLNEGFVAWLRWPVLLIVLLLGLAVLYRFGPDLDNARFRWISPGALFAALAWIAGSALLSWYLGSFADYDKTYGSLGAGIGLMMWLWMTSIVVLVGAELNSEIDAMTGRGQSEGEHIGR